MGDFNAALIATVSVSTVVICNQILWSQFTILYKASLLLEDMRHKCTSIDHIPHSNRQGNIMPTEAPVGSQGLEPLFALCHLRLNSIQTD